MARRLMLERLLASLVLVLVLAPVAGARAADVDGPAPPPSGPSIDLAPGFLADGAYTYAVTLRGFPARTAVSIRCYDSVSPGGFHTFSLTTDAAGGAFTQTQCLSANGPDHWVVGDGVESSHAAWGAAPTTPSTPPPSSADPAPVPVPAAGESPINGSQTWAGLDLGRAQNERHSWGACLVQDFAGGPLGPVVVDYTHEASRGPLVVQGSQLAGWLQRGGAPGYGCATGVERAYGGGAVQEFDGGRLYAVAGQAAAKPYVESCIFPMRWERRNLTFAYDGPRRYDENARQAAKNWTALGAGLTLRPARSVASADIVFTDTEFRGSDTDDGNWYGQAGVPRAAVAATRELPPAYVAPRRIQIRLNTRFMDDLDDFARTFVATHELGHALGLAHSEACGSGPRQRTMMRAGFPGQFKQGFNKPTKLDRIALQQLYGLPVA